MIKMVNQYNFGLNYASKFSLIKALKRRDWEGVYNNAIINNILFIQTVNFQDKI